MLELVATGAAVALVMASPRALDTLAPAGSYRCRVAPDEAMFIREPGAAEVLVRDAGSVRAGDPDAVVLDASDGWVVWTLAGDAALEAFTRLSAIPLTRGYQQGEVANIPLRLIVEGERVHMFVPAMWREYMRRQVLDRCKTFGVAESTEAASWTAVGGGAA